MPSIPQFPSENAPFLDWALYYAAKGWAVLPCRGKKPLVQGGWRAATTDLRQWQAWAAQWEGAQVNLGWAMTPYQFGFDVDPRNGGPETLYQLERLYGQLPDTLTNLTGNGGEHRVFVSPVPILHKAYLGEGIDVIAEGGYLLVPNSVHPETGRPYRWDVQYGPEEIEPAEAPQWLLDRICQGAQAHERPARTHGTVWLPEAGEPIPHGLRNETLFHLAVRRRLEGMEESAIAALLWQDHLRCEEPLEHPDKELAGILRSVMRYQPLPKLLIGEPARPPDPDPLIGPPTQIVPNEGQAWYKNLLKDYTNKAGLIQANKTTVLTVLRYNSRWAGRWWWDSFRLRRMETDGDHDTELTDERMTAIGEALGKTEKDKLPIASDRLIDSCLMLLCHETPRDPLQEWLWSLPGWDGIPRLGTWLTTCAGLKETPYHTYCARMLPVSMMARAFDPGCMCRTVLILESAEEWNKSSLIMAMVPDLDWYHELTADLENKEAHLVIQGIWVAELAELHSLQRTEETRLKSFISARTDSYIPKYSNNRVSRKRRTVFIGTTNEESYLKGLSGNTRYLPIRLENPIDLPVFQAMRDQIYAEAMLYYTDHQHDWWRMPAGVQTQAVLERDNRRLVNVYEDSLRDWLEKRDEKAVSWKDIAEGFLELTHKSDWKDRSLQMQIGAALRALGWTKKRGRKDGDNTQIWWPAKA